tara:strand:- start:4037 stop:4240 length:204 start_codon:yes stop_codon:yes gene_type:complete
MHLSHATSLSSDRNDDPVSPYLRRRLRTYAQYLRDRARRRIGQEDQTTDPPDTDPAPKDGGGNGERD